MGKFERYEPRGDSGRVFEGGEVEDDTDEGSRLPLLLVIGLLVVAAFAGVVWLAYTQGVQRGREDAPRMLVAANGPVKEAPVSPGAAETPFKGLKIYQQPAPPQDEDTESTPQAPTPAARKAPSPAAAVQPKPTAEQTPAITEIAEDSHDLSASQVATKPPHSLQPSEDVANVRPQNAPAVAKSSPKPAHAPAADKPDSHAAAADSGGVALQIGAYKSEAEAIAAWAAFVRKHAIAGAYQSKVRKADLGDKGVWYRLRLGSFPDKTAALAFCDKLKVDGGTCFLAR